MVAARQQFDLVAVAEYAEADAALAVGHGVLVQHDGEAADAGGVQALPPGQRGRLRGRGGDARRGWVEAAHPARVEEEQRHQQDDGEEHHDEEERAPPYLEVAVVEFRVVPLERLLRRRRRHAILLDWIGSQEWRERKERF